MIPVTNAAQTDKQAVKGAMMYFFVYLMLNDAFVEIQFPKVIFKLELNATSFLQNVYSHQIKLTDGV